ncbi:MAG: hypothetical protein DBY09_01075 [Selenomonadales bacterium]|jgi:hypothetical protein|nr:MAG: hypothetical protein DBY09_01075 [Selenomonadales bacterium]
MEQNKHTERYARSAGPKYVGRLFNSTYRVKVHTHELWEGVYYTDGSGIVEIDGRRYPFKKGDIFLIAPETPHTDYSDTGFKNYHYTFHEFPIAGSSHLLLHDSDGEDFLNILRQMYWEYHLKRKNWENIVNCLFDALNQYIISFMNETAYNPYVSSAVKEIIANISNPDFNTEHMAGRFALNNDYFRRLFKKSTGDTPVQFLTKKRVAFALQLLRTSRETSITIKEISRQAGFHDYYYFSRVFKKRTGLSPRRWLEKNQINDHP